MLFQHLRQLTNGGELFLRQRARCGGLSRGVDHRRAVGRSQRQAAGVQGVQSLLAQCRPAPTTFGLEYRRIYLTGQRFQIGYVASRRDAQSLDGDGRVLELCRKFGR